MSLISSVLFFPLPTYEINAQPSIFHKSIKNVIRAAPNGYEFDSYVFIKALKMGFRSIRFPVLFLKRTFGKSHWNKNLLSKLNFIKNTFFYLIKLSLN